MTRFIFVTGGVVSSLGKGIVAASLGALLEARGFSVTIMKLDPYINVDPGLMSPFQHGEVFVTNDGAETDLDLGHYERFVRMTATRKNSVSAGRVYKTVLENEKKGLYKGNTIQVIPHITDEIKKRIYEVSESPKVYHENEEETVDFAIIEIGGTVGDIESLPFLEAIRQLRAELGGGRAVFMHLTLVPYLKTSGEIKTKPTQHSVKELLSIGIQPDLLVCRTEKPLPENERTKIALFTSVAKEAVFSSIDASSIYEVPKMLKEQGLDHVILERFNLKAPAADMTEWDEVLTNIKKAKEDIHILLVGKYIGLADTYKSINEALFHAGLKTQCKIKVHYIDAAKLETINTDELASLFKGMDGVIVPGGSGDRGIEGKIAAIHYARCHHIPFLGIALGLQLAAVEYARHVLGMAGANTTEVNGNLTYPVVHQLVGDEKREDTCSKESMYLGNYAIRLEPHTKVATLYGKTTIEERHRHRYGFNTAYREKFLDGNFQISGTLMLDETVEFIELKNHPWFIATQAQPQFISTPRDPHPLFVAFIKASLEQKNREI